MPLINYKASNVRGLVKNNDELEVLIDEDFLPYADLINVTAKKYGFMAIVTSAKRESTNVQGAIVEPAKMGCHLIGHALDLNFIHLVSKEYWNSKKLEEPIGNMKSFIDEVKAGGVRWGGDFKIIDSVHFDSGLNIRSPKVYQKKYKEYFPN